MEPIENMLKLGCKRHNLQAKIFGGSAVLGNSSGILNIGTRNIALAEDILNDEKIPLIGRDVDGNSGRKILFNTKTGRVLLKKLSKNIG